jgi:hypothetical protein
MAALPAILCLEKAGCFAKGKERGTGNQCCGSGMFIPDPKTATKERGEKKFVVKPFL